MSKKGYVMSDEHKAKIGIANSFSQKGKKLSETTKKRISESHKGLKYKKWSNESKLKSSESRRGVPKPWCRGSKSNLWKGGITPEHILQRNSIENRIWRESVFARDNWICQKYGTKGGELHPHHIKNFSQYPELRFAIDNGITFSCRAHKEFHKIYGIKNNTKEQVEEFIGRKIN